MRQASNRKLTARQMAERHLRFPFAVVFYTPLSEKPSATRYVPGYVFRRLSSAIRIAMERAAGYRFCASGSDRSCREMASCTASDKTGCFGLGKSWWRASSAAATRSW